MLNSQAASDHVVSFALSSDAIEALKRVRSSYKSRPITQADRAVLFVLGVTLRNARSAQHSASRLRSGTS
jgi:hypothetical protein